MGVRKEKPVLLCSVVLSRAQRLFSDTQASCLRYQQREGAQPSLPLPVPSSCSKPSLLQQPRGSDRQQSHTDGPEGSPSRRKVSAK